MSQSLKTRTPAKPIQRRATLSQSTSSLAVVKPPEVLRSEFALDPHSPSRSADQEKARNPGPPANPVPVLREAKQIHDSRHRVSHSQRVLTFQYLQRTVGNGCIARTLDQQLRRSPTAEIQRDSLNPLNWASDLLNRVTGDAATDEAHVQGEAADHASQLNDQSTARSNDLQSKSQTQGAALTAEATTQSALIEKQSDSQGRALQNQAGAEGQQLTSESSTNSQAVQQEATDKSTQLQNHLGALSDQNHSDVNDANGTLGTESSALHKEGDSTDGQIKGQWNALEVQGSSGVKTATAQTQALVHSKSALIQEYQGAGEHDPQQFQKRWSVLQGQVNAAEHVESHLQQTKDIGEGVNAQAGGIWSKITNRGQALAGKVTSLASKAWNTLQTRWSALQSTGAKALAEVRQQASAAVTRVKNLATAAWTRLQSLASQAWPALRDMATRAWTGLKSGGTAAWLALQATAAAAWTALQNAANSIIASLTNKISGIISRINGAVGRIVQFLASAISSLISRVRSSTDKALTFLKSKAGAAWDMLQSLGSRAWQGLKDVAERAWSGLQEFGARAWAALKDIGTRVWTGLKALGARIWTGLQSLVQRAWDMLSKAWQWLKQKAQAAWNWAKSAWERLKGAALRAWEWIKSKARAALEWLKRKWAWLKAMVLRALAWLKAKWRWLKSISGVLQVLRAKLNALWNKLIGMLRKMAPVPSSPEELLKFLNRTRDEIKKISSALSPRMASTAIAGAGSPLAAQSGEPSDDYDTDNKGNAGGCGLCYGKAGPRDAGNAAHKIIQLEFEGQLMAQGLRPETEFSLTGVRPDLAWWRGTNRLEIGEIKPDNAQGIEDGRTKLSAAIPAAKLKYPDKIVAPLGAPLVGGMVFPTLSTTPGCQVQDLFVKPPDAGLYLYYCEPAYKLLKARGCQCEMPPPVPVGEKKKEKDKSTWEKFKEQLAAHPIAAAAFVAALIVLILALIVFFLPIPEPVSKVISGILALIATVGAAAIVIGLFLSMPKSEGSGPVA